MNVHPDDLSNWCRADMCSECHDDVCQHDCHVEVLTIPAVRRINWLRLMTLYVCFMAVTVIAYRFVDYAVTDALELPANLVTFALLVFYVAPAVRRWIYPVGEEERQGKGGHGE